MILTRRTFVQILKSISISALLPKEVYAADKEIRIGAIRWDAWYGPISDDKTPMSVARHNLNPLEYRTRAPFFSRTIGSVLDIEGSQEDIDKEIRYARSARVLFWAFFWYGDDHPGHKAWEYYQKSKLRKDINWCLITGSNSITAKFPRHEELLSFFSQENYEKIDNRPLLFVLHEKTDTALMALTLNSLRKECKSSGVGDPYVVIMSAVVAMSSAEARAIGGDAISAYAVSNGKSGPYAELASYTEQFWQAEAGSGLSMIPTAMTGWDRRPRINCAGSPPTPREELCVDDKNFISPGSAREIGRHVEHMVRFIKENPNVCTSKHGLIYSWDEDDEGGSSLMPAYSVNGPNTSILDSVSSALRGNSSSVNGEGR